MRGYEPIVHKIETLGAAVGCPVLPVPYTHADAVAYLETHATSAACIACAHNIPLHFLPRLDPHAITLTELHRLYVAHVHALHALLGELQCERASAWCRTR
jgi:hypothetical protein